ncbi:MAG: hypothetical protein IKQ15_05885 [Kiritimatiellae bacterium]|nr:hypothetical protein [Kiritimatiellia bacterium]
MSKAMRKVLVWAAAVLGAAGVWAGDSAPMVLDTRDGTRIASEGVAERIALSGRWYGAAARVTADGAVLATAAAGEEKVAEWVPEGTGLHVLTHESGGVALEAAFTVLGDDVVLHAGAVSGSETWAAGKVHLVTAAVTVGSGAALTIESGAVVKFMDGTGLSVASGGSCTANGVIFTHVADDTVGGDTMMDGNGTVPATGAYTLSGAITEDDATEERYTAPVQMSGTVSVSTRWRGHKVYRMTGNLTVASGATLTVAPGAVVKFDAGVSLTVASGGTLEALGTRAEPIVFTSVKDDVHGGDTNGDGDATEAGPGDWKNLKVSGTARLEHVEVLYGGGESNSSDSGMLTVPSGGTLSLVCCSVAHGLFDGVFSYGTVTGENTAIWDCDRGVNTSGGSGVFKNCVVDRCRWGVMAEGGSGTYYNCIVTRFYGSASWPTGWGLAYWSGSLRAYNCCVWSDLSGASNYRSSPSVENMVLADPQFLDADAGDFRIAAASPCVDAGDSSVAPERDAWGQPRMDVKAAENTGVPNAEGACADIGIYEVPGTVTGPMADVAVLSVSVPASARVGEEVTVAYVVTNRGTAVASGTVRDAIRLRGADEGTAGMSVEAVEAVQGYGLEPGASARMTAKVRIPAVAAGAWLVGVEANPARDFFEANLGNNRAWSAGTVEVKLDALSAGTRTVAVGAGATAGYELEGLPEAGGWVRVSGAGAGSLAVLAGNGAMPTADGGGTAAVALPDGDWLVVLPAREAGESAYLSLANGSGAPAEAEVTVSAESPALLAVSPSRVPNAGEAALTLYGCGLDAGAAALGGRKALAVERIDAARVLATFDVDGAAEVSAAGAALAGAVEIYAVKEGAKLEAWLETPGSIRDGRVFTAHVCYRNAGDAAMPMPLFKVSRLDSTTKLGLAAGEMPVETALYIGGVAPSAPAGVLKPGEEGRVAFFFQPFGSYRLGLAHMEEAEAAGAFPAFGGVAGYREAVAAAATRLALRGAAVADLHALVAQSLLERNGQPCAAISGRLVDAAARTPLAGVGISAIAAEDGGAAATAVTDSDGWFSLAGLADGAYRFLPDAGTVLAADSTNEVDVAAQADVNGLELHAVPGGRISGHVLDAEGNAVAGGTVALCDADGHPVDAVAADGFGFYEFTGLADGTWAVRAQSQGLWCAGLATNLVLGGTVRELEADFELQPGARLSGSVSYGGEAATNGMVQAITEDGVSYGVEVEENGTWSLEGLPAGSYAVRHYSATALSPDAHVTLAVGEDKALGLVSEARPLFFPTRTVGFGSLETTFLFLDPARGAAAEAWEWDFDSDGTVDSTEAQPTWTYATPGTNTVTLTMTEEGGRTTSVYRDCVRVEEEVETILKGGAILFGTNSGTLEAVEMGEGRLVLAGEPESGTLVAGMTLMGQCGEDWFCRRVLSAAKEGGKWVLATELADWSDIYAQVGMSVYVPLDLGLDGSLSPASRASRNKNELLIEGGLRGDVGITPSLGFEAVQEYRGGRKYECWALKGSLTLEAWLSLEGAATYTRNFKETVETPHVPLPAGFSFTAESGVYANGSASIRGSLSKTIVGGTVSLTLGKETWEGEDSHWLPPGSIEPIRSDFEGTVEGSLGVEFGFLFEPKVKFLETASVGLHVKPYAGLTLTAGTEAPATVDLSVGCKLGGEVNLVDWQFGWFKFKVGAGADLVDISASLLKLTGCEADFTYSPLSCPSAPGRFDFSNCSKGAHFKGPLWDFSMPPTGFDWDFGDGSGSTAVNPHNTYLKEGAYTVSLKAYGNFITGPYRKKATLHVGKPKDIPEDDKPDYQSDDSENGKSQQSWDPNEMRGPAGTGADRVVERGQWMDYTVFFENHAGDDVADAQEVTVELALDPALDWSTFEAGEVAFGDYTDLGLEGLARGRSAVALTNGTGRSVKTVLEYDEETGKAKWYLRIVDPKGTFGWPEDGSGFLPPNDPATHCGEGYLTYRAKVRDDAADGARIDAAATIVFDYNAPIATDPAWWNKVGVPPETIQVALGEDDWMDVVIGQPYGDALPEPERLGWTFAGWFTGPDGTGTEVTAETIASADTLELFAKWVRAVFGELWLDVTHGSVVVGTNGVTAGYAPDGSAVEGLAERYVLTGTSSVHSVRFAGGSFTNTWTNLVVDLDAKDAVAVALEGASVEVTLAGDNSVASGEDCAGVRVDAASALVLQGEGRLVARGGKCGAGIGGGKLQESGRVEVRAGTVEAVGGEYGAGIGGGLVAPAAGAVVITGGSVKARGSDGGEDIGGGFGREGTGVPVDAAGAEVHEVEVPWATDAGELPVVVAVELGGGRTYRYEGMGHQGDSSLWFWLPDGTYEFEAEGEDYGAHVAGASVAAVFTDPGSAHFETPAVEEVSVTETGWRVGLNPAYRTTPFDLWTATKLDGKAWAWEKAEAGSYRFDAETGAVEWLGETKGVRVFRFSFRAKE